MQGVIAKIVEARGFGFISPADGSKDVFFHCRDLDGLTFDEQLVERRVAFEVLSSDRGPRAVNVRPAQ